MNNDSSSHLPFAQLPPEARVLFYILFQTMYGPERPPIAQVRADLETIWNSEALTMDVFEKDDVLTALFDKYAEKNRVSAWWLESWGVSRREASRCCFSSERQRPVPSAAAPDLPPKSAQVIL